jgi:Dolichyl-phosphate-mannose-protein mannosyltransferase
MVSSMSRYNRLLYLLALIRIVIPYLLQSPEYGPQRDEFLYLAEGHHVAFGFMEVPPMLSVFAWLTNLLGGGMFWIKLWPSLFCAATFIVSGKIVLSLGGKAFALFLLVLAFIFGAYLRLFFLFQPNPPEVFFATLIAFSFIRFIQTGKNKWFYVFGISVGLGMLGKYSVAFFALGTAVGLLLTPYRKVFINKHFWYASIVGVLIIVPTFFWEYNHHFPVIHHMQQLKEQQLQYVTPASFLTDQVIVNFSCAFVWLAGLWFAGFTNAGRNYRFLAWSYAFVIAILLVLHGKNYYALGLYPPLFAFGAYWLEKMTAVRFRIRRYIMVIFSIATGLWIVPILLPVSPPAKLAAWYQQTGTAKLGVLKWEDLQNHQLPQDFADMLGWDEMARKMSAAYETLDSAEKKHTILFCDNYGQAGAVSFYAKKYHIPEAYSDNASFLYWMPATMHIENLLLLTDDRNEMQHPFIKNFSSAKLCDSVSNIYAREHGSLIILLKGANESFNEMFKEKIAKDKAAFKY